ncbi:MAG TPA: hypothetical protein VNX67_09375 [Solirubrobacteraceae bacterium]|nr:hypothetical protein [Solirubrobacteraceae bacterium]
MAVALLALFIALGGSAVAANHYLINSTAQINPKILKKLRGDIGPAGTNGSNGTAGAAGATGPQGPAGEKGETGPKGATGLKGEPGPKGEAGTAAAGLNDSAAGPVALTKATETTVATLPSLPVGNYLINAKVVLQNSAEAEESVTNTCYLVAGGKHIDEAGADINSANEPGSVATLSLAASQNVAVSGPVTLTCNVELATVSAKNAQINAVQVQPLTHTTG